MKMKIAVIGSGGREHAIITKLLESMEVEKVYWIGAKAKKSSSNVEIVDIDILDFPALASFVRENRITYSIVGPELPLTEGIVDYFNKENLLIFGPNKKAAKLEGSKTFAKELMLKYEVPTARYIEIKDLSHGEEVIREWGTPIVFKVDGLAQGKGVVIPTSEKKAMLELKQLIENYPSEKVFAEEFFSGDEVSYMAFASKNKFIPLIPSRDYKRIYDGNLGPNTGGMGSIAGKDILDEETCGLINENVIQRTLDGLQNEGIEFTGILYAGLMLTEDGPKVLEFNTRFGDPETQSILELMETDFALLTLNACKGEMPTKAISFSDKKAITLVLASGGYPGKYSTGLTIEGLDSVNCKAYEAGTELVNNQVKTAGGRVINLTAIGETIEECRETLYSEQQKITFLGKYFRNDIGL